MSDLTANTNASPMDATQSHPVHDNSTATDSIDYHDPVEGCCSHHHPRRLYDMLQFNKEFIKDKRYKEFHRDIPPQKRCVIVTCMDTRLTHLLPHALNVMDGDAKIIKNAGAVITHPFGGIMRSVMVALYELRADEVFVIGHKDCGMTYIDSAKTITKMAESGISRHSLVTLQYAGIDVKSWLSGFASVEESVQNSVDIIRNHPLTPAQVPVHGLIIDPSTGELDLVVDGYKELPVLTGGIPLAHAQWIANLPSLNRTMSAIGSHSNDGLLNGMNSSEALDRAIASLDIDSQDAILGALAKARVGSHAHRQIQPISVAKEEYVSDEEERITHQEVQEDSDDDSVVLDNDVTSAHGCGCTPNILGECDDYNCPDNAMRREHLKTLTAEDLENNAKLAAIIQENDSRLESLVEVSKKHGYSLSAPVHKIRKPSSGLMFNIG